MASRDHEQQPTRPKIAPEAPAADWAGSTRIVSTLPRRRAEQVDQRVLDVSVHPFHDWPYWYSTNMLKARCDEAEMDEGAREDPPPFARSDRRGEDEVRLADRTDSASEETSGERRPAREDRVGDEDGHADGDDRVGDVWGVCRVRAAGAVELAASGEVVAGLLEQPGDAVGDGTPLGGGRAAIGLAVGGDRTLEVTVADSCSATLRHPSQALPPPVSPRRAMP